MKKIEENQFEEQITCPYCGEQIRVLVDTSAGSQQYIEDCQVCCSPIEFFLNVEGDDHYSLDVRTDTE